MQDPGKFPGSAQRRRLPTFSYTFGTTMRATLRLYSEIGNALATRSKSTSFIGLGRMGSEMAFNLFSKQYANANDARFVVCDVVPENALHFTKNFSSHFPGAQIAIASTPEE